MIDVTVKTLDSQNHAFSLADDITVREFKEHIAESVSVPADSQRLIYCGRVLQDEKKLNDYDVNGKVIHLVQRAPPQPGQRGNNGGQSTQGQGWHNAQGGVYRHTRSHVHGNAMYIGTMAIPAQSVDGRGIPVQRLTSTLSGGRLGLIRRTLTRVNQIVDRLDDPNSPPNPSPPEASSSPLPHHVHVQEIDPEPVDGENGGNNGGSRLAYAATAAMAAVLQAARLNNVTDLRGNGDESGGSSATGSGNVTEEDQNAESQQQPQDPEDQATSNGEGQNNRQFNALSPMSELLERLLSTQDRLRPYIERYRTLMQTDPALPAGSGPEGVEENQRIVDGVSESLHNLSHACHALSDFIVDMSEEPPRSLSCRPILVQHSAILQTGIPIQVEAHISLQGRNANNNNNTRNEENSSDTASAPSAAAPDANASSEPTVTVNIDSSPGGTTAAQPTSDTNVPSDPIDLNESDPIPLPFGTAYNLAGNGSVEVLMEVTPEGSMETGGNGGEENQQNRNNNNNNTGGPNGATPVMSWSTTSPPNFLRNLLQAVAGHVVQGHVVQGGIATTSAAPSNTFVLRDGRQGVAVAVDSNPNPGQSTQARNNVGTHPTTATQTRSTSRPHVFHHHTHPLGNGISIGAGGFDDPFLPCNSHHVRRTPMTSSSTINVNISQQGQATPSAPAAEPQTSSQSASTCSNATTSTPQTTKANSPLVNHSCSSRVRHISANATGGQPHINISAEGGDLGQNLRNALLMLVSGNQDGFFSRSNITSNLTLADLLQSSGVGAEFFTSHESGQEENLLVDLSIVLVRNITLDGLRALRYGQSEPIAVLRRPLREFFQCYFPRATSTTTVQEVTVDRFLSQLRPHLRNILQAEECTISQTSNRIDIITTAENILRRHIADALRHLYDEHCSDETFGQEILCIVSNLGFQLCTVLRYYLRGGQAGLEAVALRFASDEMEGTHETLRHFVLNTILARFRAYTLRMVQPPDSVILPFLIYKDTTIPTSTPSASVQQTSTATQQQQQSQQQLPKPELMETDSVEDRTSNAESLPVDDAEVPETFPGHENLPSDWVPIIARDSVKQRRQFQNMIAGGVPTLSDAYLGGLPSKRRKTIEQQKPRLLASPTPNRSAIAASVERLVREGVTRAGVEEIDGATVAVASDPGVRRAFGQAIRDCLTPRRYRTPDFPDPLRFPNASKFFSEGRSPK